MTDTTGTTDEELDATSNADESSTDTSSSDVETKDWEAEFKAQQRVNRDLERRSKARMRELEAELTAARNAPKGDTTDAPDPAAIRAEIKAEVEGAALRDKALDKLEAKAARLFHNPEDARAFLADKADDFIDGSAVDVDAINDALADLLKQRPYLGVTQGDAHRFQGSGDGGPKANAAGLPQLTQADLDRMYAAKDHAGITAAKAKGQFDRLLGIKST